MKKKIQQLSKEKGFSEGETNFFINNITNDLQKIKELLGSLEAGEDSFENLFENSSAMQVKVLDLSILLWNLCRMENGQKLSGIPVE